jgi:hypothetical protein
MTVKTTKKKRTAKQALNADNLKSLGAPRLAALLMDLTAGNANAKRRLRLDLAARMGPEAVAKLARSRLGALARAETRIASKQVAGLQADLKAHLEIIGATAGKENPTLAMELLWLVIQATASIRERVLFDPGVYDVQREAVQQLGIAASAATPNPAALAEDAFRCLSLHGIDGKPIIPALAPALGETGLAHLKQRLREHDSTSRSGREILLWIADAEGDVDEFLRLHPKQERTRPRYAASIASRLLRAGRAAEALDILDAATGKPHTGDVFGKPDLDWADARIEALDALGRHEEAYEQRWSCFDRVLSARHLRGWLKKFPAFDGMEAEERAFDHAERHHPATAVLRFYLDWPDLARASAFVLRQAEKLAGDEQILLRDAAEALAARFPLAAILILRVALEFQLVNPGRSRTTLRRAEREAARLLGDAAGLAAGVADFGAHPNHGTYVSTLRQQHPYSYDFWSEVKKRHRPE